MTLEYMTLDKRYQHKRDIVGDINTLACDGWRVVSYYDEPPKEYNTEWVFRILLSRKKVNNEL